MKDYGMELDGQGSGDATFAGISSLVVEDLE
jgi:hypothetical protein